MGTAMFAGHRLAFRIARREAWRYKGRSALSITLLGLPLLAVAIGASAYDTAMLSEEETALQYLGENEAYIEFATPGAPLVQHSWNDKWPMYDMDDWEDPGRAVTDTEILASLPVGAWIAPYSPHTDSGEGVQVQTPDGLGPLRGLNYNLGDDLYEAAGLEYLEGSAPGRGEVVISAGAADYLELGVGDELVVEQGAGAGEHEVSGIVEIPWDLHGRFAIGDPFPAQATGWLVDSPEPLTKEQALALNELGLTVWAPSLLDEPTTGGYETTVEATDEAELMIYGLIVVAVVMEVVLLAGPAFAISARRRTREFALMSANGATPWQIRNTVLAGGVLFGLMAAVAAIVVGIGLVAAGLPLLEQLVGHRSAGIQVLPTLQAALVGVALATGLLSALAAAISASRVNVVEALTGRSGRRKSSKRWMFAGIAMVAAGVAAGLGGVALWSLPLMAAAIILAQLGLVACTPSLLSFIARLGRWLPLAPRLALREAGRNRGSAAPAIAAVLGVVAAGMAFSMIVTADAVRNERNQERLLYQGAMELSLYNQAGPETELDWDAVLAEVRPILESRLDEVELTELPRYSVVEGCGFLAEDSLQWADCAWTIVRPEENRCSFWEAEKGTQEALRAAVEAAREDPRCDETDFDTSGAQWDVPGSTDPQVIAAYTDLEGAELDRAVELLEAGGLLMDDPLALTDEGTVVLRQQVEIYDENGEPVEPAPEPVEIELPAMAVERGQLGFNGIFLSAEAAAAMGMEQSEWGRDYLVEAGAGAEPADVEALAADFNKEIAGGDVWANFSVTDYTDPFYFYMVIAVTGLCALIALGATAVSTGLIIAEQRRDMTTLGAVGAAPGLRKRFAMWQTVVIAVFGAGLGTVAGVVGYALIREALNRPLQWQYPFPMLYGWELPWLSFGVMLLAVPLIAAAGAVVFTRATLPSERRIT